MAADSYCTYISPTWEVTNANRRDRREWIVVGELGEIKMQYGLQNGQLRLGAIGARRGHERTFLVHLLQGDEQVPGMITPKKHLIGGNAIRHDRVAGLFTFGDQKTSYLVVVTEEGIE